MILLVLVCVATSALLVLLAVEFGRIALGEPGYPRVAALLHGVIGAVRVPGERPREARGARPTEPDPPARTPSVTAQPTDLWAEPWEVGETVERMVRERLYGNGSSRRHRVDAA